MRVLIIGDRSEDRATCIRLLSKSDDIFYTFLEADNNEDGLSLIREECPDCTLLDYNLTDSSGLGILNDINNPDRTTISPVVILTGAGNEQIAVDAMKLGCQDYLTKNTLTTFTLNHAIRGAVERVALLRKLQHRHEELEKAARYDDLTGLLNRRAILVELRKEHTRSRRYGHAITVLMVDVDNFKSVNDSFGHFMGDVILRAVGSIIGDAIRSIDSGGRYGGDEFLVVLPETSLDDSMGVAKRICRQANRQQHTNKNGNSVKVTCSIGMTCFGDDLISIETAIERADQAMYHAKNTGKNQVVVWNQIIGNRTGRSRMEEYRGA